MKERKKTKLSSERAQGIQSGAKRATTTLRPNHSSCFRFLWVLSIDYPESGRGCFLTPDGPAAGVAWVPIWVPFCWGFRGKSCSRTWSTRFAACDCSSHTSHVRNPWPLGGTPSDNWKKHTPPVPTQVPIMQVLLPIQCILLKNRNCEFLVWEVQDMYLCDRIGHSTSSPSLILCTIHFPVCHHQPRGIWPLFHFLGHCPFIPPVSWILTHTLG